MGNSISKLHAIAKKESKLILGVLSGTSMDGLDIGLWKINGNGLDTTFESIYFDSEPIFEDVKSLVLKVFHKEEISVKSLMLADRMFAEFCSSAINTKFAEWGVSANEIDLIASHGQTIFHNPNAEFGQKNVSTTLQIGDGDFIARNTGILTISDFRQKHIAAGGEGAPLSVYGDLLMLGKSNSKRIILNLGGISNATFFDISGDGSFIVASDLGPANGLLDAFIDASESPLSYDKDGLISGKGIVNIALLEKLKDHPFFERTYPKSTGREDFSLEWLKRCLSTEPIEDVARTLCRFTAEGISKAVHHYGFDGSEIIVSGGGVHNPSLMTEISSLLPNCAIMQSKEIGIEGDAKESLMFALLANEFVSGDPELFSEFGLLPIRMGKISLPD